MVGLGVTAPLSTYDSATAELVRRELACVLDSPDFIVPERARRFLSYIVGEALAGRADRIKAFSIATDVLGRGSSFDGSVDPVVRIEAGRVRAGCLSITIWLPAPTIRSSSCPDLYPS